DAAPDRQHEKLHVERGLLFLRLEKSRRVRAKVLVINSAAGRGNHAVVWVSPAGISPAPAELAGPHQGRVRLREEGYERVHDVHRTGGALIYRQSACHLQTQPIADRPDGGSAEEETELGAKRVLTENAEALDVGDLQLKSQQILVTSRPVEIRV